MGEVSRILDANINRAAEGLRTAEEFARLIARDALSQRLLKGCRADIKQIAQAIGIVGLESRDIQNDFGTDFAATAKHSTSTDVAQAGLHRAQEALRVIEEYGGFVDAGIKPTAARARYQTYQIEQQLLVNAPSRLLLEESPVMIVCDSLSKREGWQGTIELLLAAGAKLFQLREKTSQSAEFLATARQLIELVGTQGMVIINDRADIASASGAKALHVGQSDLSIENARKVVGPSLVMGASTHNRSEAEQAVKQGFDYIGTGAVFATSTKDVNTINGPDLLREILPSVDIPVFAIGGIGQSNVTKLAKVGCKHVAVSSAIWDNSDPVATFKSLTEALTQ